MFIHGVTRLLKLFRWKEGNIYIPPVKFQKLLKLIGYSSKRESLRDVLRHEFGHAVAHYHPSLIRRNKIFTETFGGRYDGEYEIEEEYDPDMYISDYAVNSPAEDWAETFMVYLRIKGIISRYRKRKGIYRKLQFVKWINKQLKKKC